MRDCQTADWWIRESFAIPQARSPITPSAQSYRIHLITLHTRHVGLHSYRLLLFQPVDRVRPVQWSSWSSPCTKGIDYFVQPTSLCMGCSSDVCNNWCQHLHLVRFLRGKSRKYSVTLTLSLLSSKSGLKWHQQGCWLVLFTAYDGSVQILQPLKSHL